MTLIDLGDGLLYAPPSPDVGAFIIPFAVTFIVIPAQAGIHVRFSRCPACGFGARVACVEAPIDGLCSAPCVDPGLRRGDVGWGKTVATNPDVIPAKADERH